MTIRKLGLLFDPAQWPAPWYVSHAALPIAQTLGGNCFRVFFSGRDAQNRAHIGAFICELTPRPRVLEVEPRALVAPGPLGAFDDSGVTSSCFVSVGNEQHLYYTGWSLGKTVPFYFAIGLAMSTDGGTIFDKPSAAPHFDRHAVDPFLVASPSILIENGVWRSWYVSAVRWARAGDDLKHYYHVRYAESADGRSWRRNGHVCIDFASEHEYAIGRPCVRRVGDHYEAWYCYRGAAYRIGYAVSSDGLAWERRDADVAGFSCAPSAWESDMQCYPFALPHDGETYVLYNGNGYGRSGIGLAVVSG